MSKKRISYRQESKADWGKNVEEGENPTREDLTFGCILRIADSTEKMAMNHTELINDRDYHKKYHDYYKDKFNREERVNRSLRGVITKLRKNIVALNDKRSVATDPQSE